MNTQRVLWVVEELWNRSWRPALQYTSVSTEESMGEIKLAYAMTQSRGTVFRLTKYIAQNGGF